MDGYKHYIRTDANGIVIKGFTTGFEQSETGDLLLSAQDGRHFTLPLANERGQYKYKVASGKMVERTQSELDTEWEARPPAPPSPDVRIAELEQTVADLNQLLIEKGITT